MIGMAGRGVGMLTLEQILSLGEHFSLDLVGTPLRWQEKSGIQLQLAFNPSSKISVSPFVTRGQHRGVSTSQAAKNNQRFCF